MQLLRLRSVGLFKLKTLINGPCQFGLVFSVFQAPKGKRSGYLKSILLLRPHYFSISWTSIHSTKQRRESMAWRMEGSHKPSWKWIVQWEESLLASAFLLKSRMWSPKQLSEYSDHDTEYELIWSNWDLNILGLYSEYLKFAPLESVYATVSGDVCTET